MLIVCSNCQSRNRVPESSLGKKGKCPKCGKNKLRRLIGTGAAIMFKGSGFYQTDYRSDSYKKKAEADKPAASTSDPIVERRFQTSQPRWAAADCMT